MPAMTETKEIYELLEVIITDLYPDSEFINGNRVEIQEKIFNTEITGYPIFVYFSKVRTTWQQQKNINSIENTSFFLEVLSLQDHDYTVAQKDAIYEANKLKGQIILNQLSISPYIQFKEGEGLQANIDRIEESHNAFLVGAGFEVNNIPLQKFISFCLPED